MSAREQLNSYIGQVERRLRLGAAARGAAILTFAALATTIVLVLITNAFGFSHASLADARIVLVLALLSALVYGLALPLLYLDRRSAVGTTEDTFPKFQQRLTTFAERSVPSPSGVDSREPFIELLAADTLEIARGSEPKALVPRRRLLVLSGIALASLGVLIWTIAAGPGYLGYGAALLWAGERTGATPFYDIRVSPGDASVRRNADELVTAQPIGLQADKMRLYARYESASKWEQVAMEPQPGSSGFEFLFAGLPEGVEYYVEAGPIRSRHFKIRVVDLAAVKQIRITYRYPTWTGMRNSVDEHGGDLHAVEGTVADLDVTTDRPLRNGVLVLDNGQQIQLSASANGANHYAGSVSMAKDGSYHVAAVDQGQPVRLSEDFFIEADKANPPDVQVIRPAHDYRASPIEEVTIAANANDPFGISAMTLHYSVNGGAEQTVNLLKQKGAKDANGSSVLSLEDFKLSPGDLVSFYVTAKDARAEAHSDISFIQVDPFEREFSQSQSAGGGGGGGGQGNQNDISEREKEIIAQTWKQQINKNSASQQSADQGKFLSEVQSKLRDQAIALAGRLQLRELNTENEEFDAFQHDMAAAAQAMNPAADQLRRQEWDDALPSEQKALQHLLQAEATFRRIQVAFGGNAAGGGGGSAGRDLASLFDLELDTQKNQYETAQTASSADQRQKDIDDALKKLDDLARRQQDLANQRNGNQSFQQRWQQEMLRRNAEELQRQMEQLAQQQSQQNGQQSGQSSSGQSSSGQSSSQQSSSNSSEGASGGDSREQRMQQALEQLRQANQDMQRAQQDSAEARRAAQRLRDATNLLGSMQQQQASGNLDAMAQQADRLASEQRAQTDRMRRMLAGEGSSESSSQSAEDYWSQANQLAKDRQGLADDLARLEKQARDAEHDLASTQRGAASKLRDALGNLDGNDLPTRLQRSADWLRRGISPNSLSAENGIASDLQRFSDQLKQAQQALGSGQTQDQAQDSQAAIDRLERLRNQMAMMTRDMGAAGDAGRQGGRLDRNGQSQGPSQPGQPGQSAQNGQPGGDRGGRLSRNGGPEGGPGPASGDVGDDYTRGYVGGYRGSARNGVNNWWIDTGNNSNLPQPAGPDNSPLPPDPERAFQQSLDGLNQLRQTVENDPETARELQGLIREMQNLDPRRFPGNPALFEQLHTQVLNDVDKLELQLQRKLDDKQSGQIRSSNPMPVPPGYQDAVADYFRRLSKNP
ncbi:MAG TPA: hypothetical protein VMB02_16690 [Candidatus Aquilonibacter sp.]|nr:hypothetical protein [Candidatus Aquilonibacter sp.]